MNKIRFENNHSHRFFLEITPMIDMVFLLVAFFLLNSSLERINSINIDLPSAEKSGESLSSDNIIRIDSQNRIYFNDNEVDADRLETVIREQKTANESKYIIEGDKSSNYDTIITVIDILGKNGVSNFILATRKK